MAAISASSAMVRTGLTATLAQRQAERAAQQAEARAQALQAESVRARREADRANERAQTLDRQSSQADSEVARLRANSSAGRGFQQLSEQFEAARMGLAGESDANAGNEVAAPAIGGAGVRPQAAAASYGSVDGSNSPSPVGSSIDLSA